MSGPEEGAPLAVRVEERAGRLTIVLGNGGCLLTTLTTATGEGADVYGPADAAYRSIVAVFAALAAALTPPPTADEIEAEIRRVFGDLNAEVAAEHLAAWLASRLVPLPPEPEWETVQVPWMEAYAEQMGVEWEDGVAGPIGWLLGVDERLYLSRNGLGSEIVVDRDGGTVPVRQERKP